MAVCKCEDNRHGPDGCLINNDGEYDEICQACYTRCYKWHLRKNLIPRIGKVKVKECEHKKHKTNQKQKSKVREFEHFDIDEGKQHIKRYCTHCADWFEDDIVG